jgi:hypothetical protein
MAIRQEIPANAQFGLTGEEGTFVICLFWLVSALAKARWILVHPDPLPELSSSYATPVASAYTAW